MPQRTVYLNGQFVPETEARLSIYDSALLLGDMAFEVTRTYHHRPFRLDQHLRRLAHTLAVLHIDCGLSHDELRELTDETLRRNLVTESDDIDWNIIHNVSRGPGSGFDDLFPPADLRPTVVISCYPLARKMARMAGAYTAGIDLVVPRQRSLPTELLDASIKTRSRLHYQLANLQAAERLPGAVAVLIDPDGYLTEGTSGNVFLVRRGELLTPEPRNLLPGITRDLVLELAHRLRLPARETNLTLDDARTADEMFVTSTSIGIVHARSFELQPVGDGSLGPLTRQLRDALTQEVGLDFAVQSAAYAQKFGL